MNIALKIPLNPADAISDEEMERRETVFDRSKIKDFREETLYAIADEVSAGGGDIWWKLRIDKGDYWFPYLETVLSDGCRIRVQGWNDMVVMEEEKDKWVTVRGFNGTHVFSAHSGPLHYSDGTFKFQTHGEKERRGSEDYPVIEDLAGDSTRMLFPDRYVVLPDGREGIKTEGLSRDDLNTIMRETGHRISERGEDSKSPLEKKREALARTKRELRIE